MSLSRKYFFHMTDVLCYNVFLCFCQNGLHLQPLGLLALVEDLK